MLTNRLSFRALGSVALLIGLMASGITLSAAEGGFSATLSAGQKSVAGLDMLTPEQRTELDRMIAAEAAAARQQETGGLSGTFLSRLTEAERKAAGLDQLSPDQLTQLNRLVADAVAVAPKPKERPRIRDSDVFNPPKKPEVHGEVSLTYGRGSGGSEFRAASMWVDYFDPNTGFGLSVGITKSKGKGFYGFYPGYGYYDSPFYGPGFGYYPSPYRSFAPYEVWDDNGQSFRGSASWNRNYYRGFLRQ